MDAERLDIEKTLNSLTREEKVRMLSGDGMWHTFAAGELPRVRMSDGPNGLRMSDDAQSSAVPATCYPTLGMLANSWDPATVFGVGAAIGREATAMGVNLLLAPGLNIKRDPLCGRNFEYFSEDPLLAGELGKAYVSGVQSTGVGACIKHFAANNQEYMRMYSDSTVDEKALHEIYLKPFEIALGAQPAAVMCAYNKLNGQYCSQNKKLLTDELRGRYGFSGAVISDWGAVRDRADALEAGLDLAMPDSGGLFEKQIYAALDDGRIDEKDIDDALRRLIKLTDDVYLEPFGDYDGEMNSRTAYNAAAACLVLLKNSGVLPLEKDTKLAVCGALAECAPIQGGGSSHVSPTDSFTPLEALKLNNAPFEYASGYCSDRKKTDALAQEAVRCAKNADVALVFVGRPTPAEGLDCPSLDLPPEQNALIDRLADSGAKIVAVLCGAGPAYMPWADKVDAIVYSGLNGGYGAQALIDAIFGKISPCAKLAETFPIEVQPGVTESSLFPLYKESIFVGYRYYDAAEKKTLFPFGHGLTYSNITYDGMRLIRKGGAEFDAEITLTNRSARDGYEIVQIYVSDNTGRVMCAKKQLAAFCKVFVQAGETASAHIHIPPSAFRFFDVRSNAFRTSEGAFTVCAAASATDIKLSAAVHIDGDYRQFDAVPAEYSLPLGSEFTDEAFQKLYGALPPRADRIFERGQYTLDNCINDLQGTFIGKITKLAISRKARKLGKKGSADYEMIMQSALTTPLCAVASMSDGALTLSAAEGIVCAANGKFFKGLKLILKKR